jgi:adenine-specific DNA-methyltransferase
MPTLNWIEKRAVVKHYKDVPYRLLEPVPELSYGDPGSGNLIVQGDNLFELIKNMQLVTVSKRAGIFL